MHSSRLPDWIRLNSGTSGFGDGESGLEHPMLYTRIPRQGIVIFQFITCSFASGAYLLHREVSVQGRKVGMQWESIWLERIRAYWHEVNEGPLRSRLRPPTFRLDSALGTLGTYQPGTRTLLDFAREHLETESWANVQHTIRHEMAHQVVAELLDGGDGRPHGPSFQRALDWIENGTGTEEGSSERETPIRRRIARLLALAQSENVHEARRAMETANLLLLRYNLKEVGSGRYIRRRLGDLRMRIP